MTVRTSLLVTTVLGLASSACVIDELDELDDLDATEGTAVSGIASSTAPFLQASSYNHLVSMEGESFHAKRAGTSGDAWQLRSTQAGFSGTGYMETAPNDGSVQGFTTVEGTSLSYRIEFVASGTHHVWLRARGCGGGNDGVHVALDGAAAVRAWQTDATCTWAWSRTTLVVPSTGTHTLSILMNEDGLKLDKIVLSTSASYAPPATGVGPAESPHATKFHPGHYISMVGSDDDADMLDALREGVRGVQIRYRWRELEPTKGSYDFRRIKGDLDLLAANGGHLIVLVEDKSFDPSMPVPAYLAAYALPNKSGGYTAKRWDPYVVARYKALMQRLGAAFDAHPALEGIAVQETALSLSDSVLSANGYSPEALRDAYIDLLKAMRAATPRSQTFWFMNFLIGNQGYLADIAAEVAPFGVTMGGPDILPESESLLSRTYPLYDEFAGEMNLFCSAQFDSYAAIKSATGAFYTPAEIFAFARDQLHVKYVFWNRKSWNTPAGSYNWLDALPVMANNPRFNGDLGP